MKPSSPANPKKTPNHQVSTLSNDKSKQQIVAFVSDDEEENEKERKRILEVDHKKKIKEIQD